MALAGMPHVAELSFFWSHASQCARLLGCSKHWPLVVMEAGTRKFNPINCLAHSDLFPSLRFFSRSVLRKRAATHNQSTSPLQAIRPFRGAVLTRLGPLPSMSLPHAPAEFPSQLNMRLTWRMTCSR